MAYTAPSITTSGTTFAQFQAGGIKAILENLITANTLTASQNAKVRAFYSGPQQAGHKVQKMLTEYSEFLGGRPVDIADWLARALDNNVAAACLSQAFSEAGTLIFANQGTLKNLIQGNVTSTPYRSFP